MFPAIPTAHILERVERIELSTKPWQGLGLPLHHTRFETLLIILVERDRRIELLTLDWKSKVIPFYESRIILGAPQGTRTLTPFDTGI